MSRKIVAGTSPNEDKPIAIFEMIDNNFECYSIENKHFMLTRFEMLNFRKKPRTSPFIFIKKNERDMDLKLLSIKQQCNKITKEAIKLKELSKNQINLFRTGSVAKTSLQLFYDLSKGTPEPEQIEEYEVDILESGTGALIYGNKYEGMAYKYDIVSEYPSIMASCKHKFPIGKGELKTFTKKEFDELTFYQFGMYHCKIINIDYRLMKQNIKNWYTHTDLNYAKNKLNYKIELIEDDEPNSLLYDNSKLITGKVLFGKFVDELFKLKKDHKEFKKYLNALWGAMCQTNVMKISDNTIHAGKEILTITPNGNGNNIFETYLKSCFYETNYARLKPFLMSYGRHKISTIILPNIDNILRTHTDGIILKEPIKNIKCGTELGDLKFEEKGLIIIKNANSYIWYVYIQKLKECLLKNLSLEETRKVLTSY